MKYTINKRCCECVLCPHLRSPGLSWTCRRPSWCHRSKTPAVSHLSAEPTACSWDLPTTNTPVKHLNATMMTWAIYTNHDALTSTATDWAVRSQGGRMGRGRVTSQYAVREARAPKPSKEVGDRDREDREKLDRGRDGRRLQKSSDSDPLIPVLERSERNHSWKCIAERWWQKQRKTT